MSEPLQTDEIAFLHNHSFHFGRVTDGAPDITRYAASGDDTVIQYDARGEVRKITVGSTQDQFWYGSEGQRFLKRATWDDEGAQQVAWTLYLFGGAYEQVHPLSDAQVLYSQQVQVTGTVAHRRTVEPIFTATSVFEYRHRDHLGGRTRSPTRPARSSRTSPSIRSRNADGRQDLTPAGLELLLSSPPIRSCRTRPSARATTATAMC